jgi:hypothetical protein
MPNCPKCDTILDRSLPLGNRAVPKENDITLCAHCITLLVFTQSGFRLAKVEDIRAIPLDAFVKLVVFMRGLKK